MESGTMRLMTEIMLTMAAAVTVAAALDTEPAEQPQALVAHERSTGCTLGQVACDDQRISPPRPIRIKSAS